MALIPYPDRDGLAPETRELIAHFEDDHGRPSLLRLMLSGFPPALEALDGLYHPVMEGGALPRRLKEMLFVASAHARGCFYCAGGHSRFLVEEFGFEQEHVVALREATDMAASPAERAALEFVRKLSTEQYRTVPADAERLAEHGYSQADVLEMTTVAALAGFTTTIASGLHLEDDLDRFGMTGYF